MSENGAKELAESCPICNGPMAAMQTFCASCRAELERSTMAVRAEDYPPPSMADRPMAPKQRMPLPGASDLMDTRVDTDTGSDDAPDLLDLVPIDEPVRLSTPSPVSTRLASAGQPESYAGVSRSRPAPGRTPVETDKPSTLQPEGRWKAALVVVGIVILAGLIGAAIWSFVIPGAATSPEPDASSVSSPAP